ncbi:hypothetical protein TNCV_1460961 [Trichonephila clavipes]|nr:hypothetical protein TNCV_1460961 [Trichonephila clavipes]
MGLTGNNQRGPAIKLNEAPCNNFWLSGGGLQSDDYSTAVLNVFAGYRGSARSESFATKYSIPDYEILRATSSALGGRSVDAKAP